MPAQIGLPFAQLERIYMEAKNAGGAPVVLFEGIGAHHPEHSSVLDVWVIDEESANSDTHRSVLIDTEGSVLGDQREHDDE